MLYESPDSTALTFTEPVPAPAPVLRHCEADPLKADTVTDSVLANVFPPDEVKVEPGSSTKLGPSQFVMVMVPLAFSPTFFVPVAVNSTVASFFSSWETELTTPVS